MKKRKGSLAAAVLLTAIVAFLAVDAGFTLYNTDRLNLSTPFCVLDIIRGNLQVMKKDALSWEKAEDGMMLEPGTRIKTSQDAHASLTFTRGTTTKLEPGTDLVIDKIEESDDFQPYTVVLKQQSGTTWNQVDKTSGQTSFQIRTSSADIQVHGTLFATEVDETGKTTVQTTEGRVSVKAGGQEVQVPAGMMTEVEPHETPSAPAPVPEARNELVITVNNQVFGVVKDPSGSGTGYLNSGVKINQISGSSVSVGEETGQMVNIKDPESGEYTLMLRGVSDGTGEVTVEGFVEGKSVFKQIASCNITAAKETLLKLHYDVIDGLLHSSSSNQGVALAAELSGEDEEDTGVKPAPEDTYHVPEALSETEEPADSGFKWFGGDGSGRLTQLVMVGSFIALIGVIFIIWRRSS